MLVVGCVKLKVLVSDPAADSKLKAAGTAVRVSLGLISPSQVGDELVPPMLMPRYNGDPHGIELGKAV